MEEAEDSIQREASSFGPGKVPISDMCSTGYGSVLNSDYIRHSSKGHFHHEDLIFFSDEHCLQGSF